MVNAHINSQFLFAIDAKTRAAVLENIAAHYGISAMEALEEVTNEESEHLLEYVTGPERAATGLLMNIHGCR